MSTLASVVVRDVYANLPSAGIPGRMFYATDTNVALRDNGTGWDSVTALDIQVNGTNAGSQTKLNLVPGSNVTITDNGTGSLTVAASGSSPSGAANLVVATPNGSSGASSLRTLVPADLPVATTSAFGAVKPDGTTVTVSSGVISATGGSTPSGAANLVVATPNGSSGTSSLRSLVSADLPVATTSNLGAVKPDGTTITIASGVISSVGGSVSGAANYIYATPDLSSGAASLRLQTNNDLPKSITALPSNPTMVALTAKGATGYSTPTLVQSTSAVQSTATYSKSFTSNVSVGNTIVVTTFNQTASATAPTVSDNLGNTYTQRATASGGGNFGLWLFTAVVTTGGSCTVTVTPPGTSSGNIAIHEYSGLANPTVVDGTPATAVGNTTTPKTLGPVTTTAPGMSFVVASYTGASTATASGFTQRQAISGNAGLYTADVNEIAGNQNAVFTTTGTTALIFICFKAQSSSGQVGDLQQYQDPTGNVLSRVNNIGQFVLAAITGTPSGTPSAGACCFDSSANKLWVYNGTAWKGTVLT